jgi:HSP20 family protein
MTTAATLEKETTRSDVQTTRSRRFYRPTVDILELPNELLVVANVPGATSGEIDVHFEDGQLTVRAPVRERQPEGTRYLLREYGVGEFFRTFRVSEQIDASRIEAEYADGVLRLHLPKVEAVKPRKIVVKG